MAIDVIRDEEAVAIAVSDLSAGARQNVQTTYTAKEFKPPVFKEAGAISAFNQINSVAGQSPYENPDYMLNALDESFSIFRKLERKIRRAVELMASQVLQTGKLVLTDSNGATLYGLDFQPKSTHFVTVGTTWAPDGSTGDPMADISALADVIRRDGKVEPTRLVFGMSAFTRFLANAKVKDAFAKTGLNRGAVDRPEPRGSGAKFQGFLEIGFYRYELWTYDGFYKDPQSGLLVPYIDPEKMLIMCEKSRLDLTFGAVPMIVAPDQRALPFLPPRLSSSAGGLDLFTNAYVSEDGSTVMVSAAARPLTIPTAIDTFGCLDVTH